MKLRLGEFAHARSGDKGSSANVGVIAYTDAGYELIRQHLTAHRVQVFFAKMGVGEVVRYELPNLLALNFILPNILNGGGSTNLRIDAQGKALGQALLEIQLDVPDSVDVANLKRR
jgi:hypothetical protein